MFSALITEELQRKQQLLQKTHEQGNENPSQPSFRGDPSLSSPSRLKEHQTPVLWVSLGGHCPLPLEGNRVQQQLCFGKAALWCICTVPAGLTWPLPVPELTFGVGVGLRLVLQKPGTAEAIGDACLFNSVIPTSLLIAD